MWKSEDNFVVLISSPTWTFGSRNHIQVTSLAQHIPLPGNTLHQPNFVIFRALLLLTMNNLNQCSNSVGFILQVPIHFQTSSQVFDSSHASFTLCWACTLSRQTEYPQGKLELLFRTCELRVESKLHPKYAEMMWPTVSKVRGRECTQEKVSTHSLSQMLSLQ